MSEGEPLLRVEKPIIERLLARPQGVAFFQAVRMLELWYVRAGERGAEVLPNRLRFANTLSLAFAPSEIEAVKTTHSAGADEASPLLARQAESITLTPRFFGLTGAAGTLPYYYTERIGQQEASTREHSARAFLDIFSNRSVALFYAAWKKYRPALQAELDRKERFLPLVLSLAGLGFRGLRERHEQGSGQVFDEALAHYGAALRQRPVSAAVMQQILSHYFGCAVRVEQFVGRWFAVPPEQRSALGRSNATLGATALSGTRVWQRNLRLRVWIGPLTRERYQAFLPGGDCAAALTKLLTLFTGVTLEYEIRLLLRAEDVRGTTLGDAANGGGGRLGWDSTLSTRPATEARADVGYLVHALP